jgi:hypothetical protein
MATDQRFPQNSLNNARLTAAPTFGMLSGPSHTVSRPVRPEDNANTTGALLDNTRPKKPSASSIELGGSVESPLSGIGEAVAKIRPTSPGVLGEAITGIAQARQQHRAGQSGPTAGDERRAHRQNRSMDEHGQRMGRAQEDVNVMRARDLYRTDSERPVERPGVTFDENGNGYFGEAGAMVHRNPNPPASPMAARQRPPEDPSSPAASRRIPRPPTPFAGANAIPTTEPTGFGEMSGAL